MSTAPPVTASRCPWVVLVDPTDAPLQGANCRARSCDEEQNLPRISEFYGIAIYLYYQDHAPPHFHAIYGE